MKQRGEVWLELKKRWWHIAGSKILKQKNEQVANCESEGDIIMVENIVEYKDRKGRVLSRTEEHHQE